MASNLVLITQTGLDNINEAHPNGPLIDVAYYVPVYDYRIDPNVFPVTTASPTDITTVASEHDTYPEGDVFWKASGVLSMSLSTRRYILSGAGYTGGGTSELTTTDPAGMVQKSSTDVTLMNGYPYPDYFYTDGESYYDAQNDKWVTSTTWVPSGSIIREHPASDGYKPADLSNPELINLYSGVTYNSVITTGTDKVANFRVVVTSPNGDIKFNKIGLYAVKRLGNDAAPTQPFLFAEVIIPEPQIVSNSNVGSGKIGELVVDFQLDAKTVTSAFDNLIYATSGDYWERVSNEGGTYGLAYDGSVYISNRLAVDDKNFWINTSADGGVSKLFVSTFEEIMTENPSQETDKPQACFQYVTKATGTTASKRIRTTFRTNAVGNCEVDFYGACTSDEIYSLVPKYGQTFGLGIDGNRWKYGYFSDRIDMNMSHGSKRGNYYSKFFADMNSLILETDGLDIICNDAIQNASTHRVLKNKFVKANVKARDTEILYVRSSTTSDGKDTDAWIVAGNYSKKNGSVAEYEPSTSYTGNGSENGNLFIRNGILAYYANRSVFPASSGDGDWYINEMNTYKGGLYLVGNGYVYIMASALFMEDPLPFIDGLITMGHEGNVDSIPVPKAFANVVTQRLSNAGRDIGIRSSLIPTVSEYKSVLPSLGNALAYFSESYISVMHAQSIYSDTVNVSGLLSANSFDLNTGTIKYLTVDHLIPLNIDPVSFSWNDDDTLLYVESVTSTSSYFDGKNMNFKIISLQQPNPFVKDYIFVFQFLDTTIIKTHDLINDDYDDRWGRCSLSSMLAYFGFTNALTIGIVSQGNVYASFEGEKYNPYVVAADLSFSVDGDYVDFRFHIGGSAKRIHDGQDINSSGNPTIYMKLTNPTIDFSKYTLNT